MKGELKSRDLRELRLRKRIDELADRAEKLEEKLEEASKRRNYYRHLADRRLEQISYWKQRALGARWERKHA